MLPETMHLNIGSLLFEDLDQIDLTGPFEVLSRIPNQPSDLREVARPGARPDGATPRCRTRRLRKRRNSTSCTSPADAARRP